MVEEEQLRGGGEGREGEEGREGKGRGEERCRLMAICVVSNAQLSQAVPHFPPHPCHCRLGWVWRQDPACTEQ